MIFDVGANRGLFTDACIMNNPTDKIIVIEANPNLFDYLVEKYKNNDHIEVINSLISNENDVLIPFYLSNVDVISTASIDWITNSRFVNRQTWCEPLEMCTWYEPIQVKSRSLDSIIDQYGIPELIKVDVEGYEFEVLSGLTKKAKDICFEWAEEQYESIKKTCDHLKTLGYTEFGFIEDDEYLKKPEVYTCWENSPIHSLVKPDRKEKWGMIWVR
jgi:FkbM family methyltransferase